MTKCTHSLSRRELATILAALRLWQQDLEANASILSEHFEEVTPLTPVEIDVLCERLNCHPRGTP